MHHHTELSFVDEFRWVSPLHYFKNGWQNAVLLWCMLQAGPPSLHYYCAVVLHSCIALPPVGHSSNHQYHCCQLTRQSSCDSNFYRTYKVFIWLSLVSVILDLWSIKNKLHFFSQNQAETNGDIRSLGAKTKNNYRHKETLRLNDHNRNTEHPPLKQQHVGVRVDHPPPYSAEVKERVGPYIYSPSGPSRRVLGDLYLTLLDIAPRYHYISAYFTSKYGSHGLYSDVQEFR